MNDKWIWSIAGRAEHSAFFRFLLNGILSWAIPFNAPHGYKVCSLSKGRVRVVLPNKRVNRNHVKSIHACGLAALCEYAAGLAVMTLLEPSKYRMVLKSLHMDYHYRAKGDISCLYELDGEAFSKHIILCLETSDAVLYETQSNAYDLDGNLVCTGKAVWQIKKWTSVKAR
jgi:acyl-coenzyme A thioesterase PaaI-like protein